jgi:hypothetical protein
LAIFFEKHHDETTKTRGGEPVWIACQQFERAPLVRTEHFNRRASTERLQPMPGAGKGARGAQAIPRPGRRRIMLALGCCKRRNFERGAQPAQCIGRRADRRPCARRKGVDSRTEPLRSPLLGLSGGRAGRGWALLKGNGGQDDEESFDPAGVSRDARAGRVVASHLMTLLWRNAHGVTKSSNETPPFAGLRISARPGLRNQERQRENAGPVVVKPPRYVRPQFEATPASSFYSSQSAICAGLANS